GQATLALEQLLEALHRFEALGEQGERMAVVALGEQADCLTALGRLDDAAKTYEEKIKRAEKLDDFRGVAVGKGQLATVRMYQKKYAAALAEYQGALAIFEKQDEPKSIATIWHQIGMVHQEAGDYESAEAAYRRSLEIKSQNDDRTGQANSLTALGVLYNDNLNRKEEAITFYRQAADIYVQTSDLRREGMARNNTANTLHQLKRYDEARAEIIRAIECDKQFGHASEPWKTFAVLREIEIADGNPAAARAAWVQARDAYLAYRRQGGYASAGGNANLMEHVVGLITQQKADEIEPLFNELANSPKIDASGKKMMQIIITILNGSRDKVLGDDPALYYGDAAEVLFLIERLGG
ncbi:MAG: tetratricopeptide repeat protein, partial [Anaerolineales bacterium]|nr:tetratricopeptide repeat protein [Anaerolineales bacterium]